MVDSRAVLNVSRDDGYRLDLPMEVAGLAVAVVGRRGSGKSYLSSVLAEEMIGAGLPVVMVDPTGSGFGLKSSADGKKPGLPVVVFGGDHGDLPLNHEQGEAVARAFVQRRFSTVLDTSQMRKGERRRFMTDFLETLYRLNTEPVNVILDEADDAAPQKPYGDQARLLGACEDLVRRGRRKGIGCVLVTQRPQCLNKDVLSQCEILFSFRLSHPLDLGAVKAWVETNVDSERVDEMLKSLPALPCGTAWCWSPIHEEFAKFSVRVRRTFDSGAPRVHGTARAEPKVVAEVDLEAIREAVGAAAEDDFGYDPGVTSRDVVARSLYDEKCREAESSRREAESLRTEALSVAFQILEAEPIIKAAFGRLIAFIAKVGVDRADKALLEPTPSAPVPSAKPSAASSSKPTKGGAGYTLSVGEGKILRAAVQLSDGRGTSVPRAALTALTGYKKSTRDVYIGRLVASGLVGVESGMVAVKQTDAVKRLVETIKPLPLGPDLLKHYLANLPEGEAAILKYLASTPFGADRESVTVATGYKKSTRDVYIGRLRTRELILIVDGRLHASPLLKSKGPWF